MCAFSCFVHWSAEVVWLFFHTHIFSQPHLSGNRHNVSLAYMHTVTRIDYFRGVNNPNIIRKFQLVRNLKWKQWCNTDCACCSNMYTYLIRTLVCPNWLHLIMPLPFFYKRKIFRLKNCTSRSLELKLVRPSMDFSYLKTFTCLPTFIHTSKLCTGGRHYSRLPDVLKYYRTTGTRLKGAQSKGRIFFFYKS